MTVTFLTRAVPARLLQICLCCLTAPVFAADTAMLDAIRHTAETFALQQVADKNLHGVVADAATLDPRLRLRQCDSPLEAFATGNAGNLVRMTVAVRCTTPNPWTLYVPVSISATTDVVYTTRALIRGEDLGSTDLEIRRVSLERLPAGYLSSTEQLANMELVRPLKSGTALTLNALRTRDAVRQGQEVVIVAEGSGLQVRMAGTALKNGSLGDIIRVRNSNSGRVVEATVLSDSTVRVNL